MFCLLLLLGMKLTCSDGRLLTMTRTRNRALAADRAARYSFRLSFVNKLECLSHRHILPHIWDSFNKFAVNPR
jgi:hypothetical protein